MKECEVMEVLGDHPDAMDMKFYYTTEFINNVPLGINLYREDLKNTSEKKKKKIIKVVELLLDKIRYE